MIMEYVADSVYLLKKISVLSYEPANTCIRLIGIIEDGAL